MPLQKRYFSKKVYPEIHLLSKMANKKTSFQKQPPAEMACAAKLNHGLAKVLNSKQIIHKYVPK